jgi:ribonuclease Y
MEVLLLLLAAVGGAGGGYAARYGLTRFSDDRAKSQANKILEDAKTKQKEILLQAKDEAIKLSEEAKKEERERRDQIAALEQRLASKEEAMDKRTGDMDKRQEALTIAEKEINEVKEEIRDIKQRQLDNLAKVAKLTKDGAKKVLLEIVEKEFEPSLTRRVHEMQQVAAAEADDKAREIISTVIQRIAPEYTSETTVSTVELPSDELKGRVIGKEGRNIQAFERATGMDIIVDDTPGLVVISGFDPVRRHIAKLSLEKLLKDGRIQPTRIEEVVAKTEKEVDQAMKEAGEKALYELGITGIHPDLVKILGRLNYRTSYGQNVLRHSVEAAHIASMLAAELGANEQIAKMGALFHDLGKALDHEVEGSHVTIGRDIAKKYGLPEAVIHCIEAHHEDVPFSSTEAIITQVSDAISGARPGARRESLENYVKRVQELENLASSFEGVDKAYAIQAGREIRVIVKPEEISDLEAERLAKEVAGKIEETQKYPGQIKVQVIRETRAIEYAK